MIFIYMIMASAYAADAPTPAKMEQMHKECFELNRGRSCVQLGTVLWQIKAKRIEARAAFAQGCDLKVEAACDLKKLPSPDDGAGEKATPGAGAAAMTNAVGLPRKAGTDKIVGIERKSDTKFTVSRAAALGYAADLDGMLETAKVEPSKNAKGVVQGYRFVTIDDQSVFATLGFQVGDVISEVNGEPITSPAQARSLLPSLAFAEDFAIKILRKGKVVTQNYQLVE